jgi:hypothetical protein
MANKTHKEKENSMKRQAALFLLPIVVLILIGAVVGVRWWRSQTPTASPSPIPLVSETSDLSDEEAELIKKANLSEKETVTLKKVNGADAVGAVKVSENRNSLTVAATLPMLKTGEMYQVWLKAKDGSMLKIGVLSYGKGGYMLDYRSAAPLPSDAVIVVSRETNNDSNAETILLEGMLKK